MKESLKGITVDLLPEGTRFLSERLLDPWRLISLLVGLVILILGSGFLPSEDWDVSVCFVMGLPAYVIAPWSFRQFYYMRWRWWPMAIIVGAFSIDGTYTLYWWMRDFQFLEQFRLANLIYCLPIFLMSGFIWNLDIRRHKVSIGIGSCRGRSERERT